MNTRTTVERLVPHRSTLRFLILLVCLLAIVNAIDLLAGNPVWPITRHIDMGSDTNMAAWFSSVLLAVGGIAALQCAEKARAMGQAPWFYLLALFMFLMSCDEIARLHEIVAGDLSKLLGIMQFSFAQHAAWVWVGGPVIAVLFVAMAWMMRAQLALVPGTMTMLSAGLAVMFLGGVMLESTINFLDMERMRLIWKIEIIVEESLEMFGSLMIVYALVAWRDAWNTE